MYGWVVQGPIGMHEGRVGIIYTSVEIRGYAMVRERIALVERSPVRHCSLGTADLSSF